MIKGIKQIYEYRELLISLISKTLNARYKGSFLGFLWTFINPLMHLLIYAFVFQVIFRVQEQNYTMLLFVALLPWTGFSSALMSSMTSVTGHANLVKKIYFPRMILPLSVSLTYIIDYLYCIPILLLAMFMSHLPFTRWILLFPAVLLIHFVFQTGLCLAISAINVRYRDTKQIIGIATMAWFYFTPILYKMSMIPESWTLMGVNLNPRTMIVLLNPMTGIMSGYRASFFHGQAPDAISIIAAVAWAVIALVVGWIVFNKFEKTFAEDL